MPAYRLYVVGYIVLTMMLANQIAGTATHYDASLGSRFGIFYQPFQWFTWWTVERTDAVVTALAIECVTFFLSFLVLLWIQEIDERRTGVGWGWWEPVLNANKVVGDIFNSFWIWRN